MNIQFAKATKTDAKLRLSIVGPSGAGKTYTSLAIATHLVPGGKVALIDTEHGSASKYADLFDFSVAEMTPPFHPDKYVEAIRQAAAAGFDVLILDSLSHAWNGSGGLLDIVEEISKRMKNPNSFAAWKDATPIQTRLFDGIVNAPIHIIATMRSKTEYVLQDDGRGRQVPRKVGMAPIQRENSEYEFDVVLDMDADNNAVVSKTRCTALTGRVFARPSADIAAILADWLHGETPQDKPATADQKAPQSPTVGQKTLNHLHALGTELYGKDWENVRHRNVKRVTNGRTESSAELTEEEAGKLIVGMEKLKAQQAQKAAQENAPAQETQQETALEEPEQLPF